MTPAIKKAGAVLTGSVVVLSGLAATPVALAEAPASVNAPTARVNCPDWKVFYKVRGNRLTCAMANDMMWLAIVFPRKGNRKIMRKYGWDCGRLLRPRLPPTEEKWRCGPYEGGYIAPGTGNGIFRFSVRIDVN